MTRELSEAEIQQRRDAAKRRWADAGLAAGAAGAAGYSAPQAFLSPRAPTRGEVHSAYRQEGKVAMGLLRGAGADTATRSRLWAGQRSATVADIKDGLRPIGDRKVQAASSVALALAAGGIALSGITTARNLVDDRNGADDARAAGRSERALQWGAGTLGAMGALRAALPHVRRIPRVAIAATGAGAAAYGATRKDR